MSRQDNVPCESHYFIKTQKPYFVGIDDQFIDHQQTKITTFDDHNLLLEIVTHLKLVKLGMNICVLI